MPNPHAALQGHGGRRASTGVSSAVGPVCPAPWGLCVWDGAAVSRSVCVCVCVCVLPRGAGCVLRVIIFPMLGSFSTGNQSVCLCALILCGPRAAGREALAGRPVRLRHACAAASGAAATPASPHDRDPLRWKRRACAGGPAAFVLRAPCAFGTWCCACVCVPTLPPVQSLNTLPDLSNPNHSPGRWRWALGAVAPVNPTTPPAETALRRCLHSDSITTPPPHAERPPFLQKLPP